MSGASRKASTLYRTLLRAHKRHLPPDMQSLGNSYLQSEFRAHRKATPAQAEAFFQAWDDYHQHLMTTVQEREKQERNAAILAVQGIAAEEDAALATVSNTSTSFGKQIPDEVDLSEEQKQQLQKLRDEAIKSTGGGGE